MIVKQEREQLCIEAGRYALDIVQRMDLFRDDSEEFKRLDKVAMRATSLLGSLARLGSTAEIEVVPGSSESVPQEQEAA